MLLVFFFFKYTISYQSAVVLSTSSARFLYFTAVFQDSDEPTRLRLHLNAHAIDYSMSFYIVMR